MARPLGAARGRAQDRYRSHDVMAMDKIAAGVLKFQHEIAAERRSLFQKLADGQRPRALFITCSDSRIDPCLLTQTDPGELFICRNAGNIVPPHTHNTGAMTASIEYAAGALEVPHIIICGHSDCAALKGALQPESLEEFPHFKLWLGYAKAATFVVRENAKGSSPTERLRMLIEQNVVLQMQHLKTHPYVAARLAAGKTRVHGWVYDIGAGEVVAFDESAARFVPVADRYRELLES